MKVENVIAQRNEKKARGSDVRKDTLHNAAFCNLMKGRTFLYFAEVVTMLAIACTVGLIKAYPAIASFCQGPGLAIPVLLLVEIVIGFLTGSIWNLYWDARVGYKGKNSGVLQLLVMHWVMLGLMVAGFLVTLPLFTEILTYSEERDATLQLIYCCYVLAGLYIVVALRVLMNLYNNLSFWSASAGPINGLLGIFAAAAAVLVLVMCITGVSVIAALALTATVLMINLLLQYMDILKNCRDM